MTRRWRMPALATLLGVLPVACGGDDDDAPAGQPAAKPATGKLIRIGNEALELTLPDSWEDMTRRVNEETTAPIGVDRMFVLRTSDDDEAPTIAIERVQVTVEDAIRAARVLRRFPKLACPKELAGGQATGKLDNLGPTEVDGEPAGECGFMQAAAGGIEHRVIWTPHEQYEYRLHAFWPSDTDSAEPERALEQMRESLSWR